MIISFFKRLLRKQEKLRLAWTDEGLKVLRDAEMLWAFEWSQVVRIQTYKMDRMTYDTIFLAFDIGDQNNLMLTHDEMDGFNDLCVALRNHFPSIPENWWSDVAFPAFATNQTMLYDRKAEPAG